MKMRICMLNSILSYLLMQRRREIDKRASKNNTQKGEEEKNARKVYTYWISFENLNIWLLLPVWKIEQFWWWRTCCEVILSRLRTNLDSLKIIMKAENFLTLFFVRLKQYHFHTQDTKTHIFHISPAFGREQRI